MGLINAKFNGRCTSCGHQIKGESQPGLNDGDKVEWVKGRKGVVCGPCYQARAGGLSNSWSPPLPNAQPQPTMKPAGINWGTTQAQANMVYNAMLTAQMEEDLHTALLNNGVIPQATTHPSFTPKAQPPPPIKVGISDRILAVLVLVEPIIIDQAIKHLTPEREKQWEKYQKLKAVMLAPGSPPEGHQAMKMALIEGLKLAL